MRVFVTGASGWIGSAVVPELLGAGHEVVGLARSEASAQRLEAAGAIVQRGDVDDPDGLAKAAADSDGVIHLAFQHEVAFGGNFAAAAAADRRAVEAMGAALAGSDRPFVLASGMLGLAAGRVATEDDGLVPERRDAGQPGRAPGGHRPAHPVAAGHRRALVGAAPPADGPRRRRPRVRRHPRRHRPPAGRRRPTWATAPTAGRPCTVPTPPAWPGWPSSRPRPARCCTRSATRASPSATSPRRWAATSGVPAASVAPAEAVEHFSLPRPLRRAGQPGHRRGHPGAPRLGADRAEPARGPRRRTTTTAEASSPRRRSAALPR